MIFLCEDCNIRSLSYNEWMEHLLGRRHQAWVGQNINKWSKYKNDRSLIVTVSGENRPKREDVCWHFAGYGFICDVYFSPEFDFYVIQLDTPEYAKEALDFEIKQTGIFSFKLRKDMAAEEWIELMGKYKTEEILEKPLVVVLSFEQRHLKLVQNLKHSNLNCQLEIFREEVSIKPKEIKARMDLIDETTSVLQLQKKFQTCKLHPYGSFVAGIGSHSSVLHIFFEGRSLSPDPELQEDKITTTEGIVELFVERIESKNRVDFFCSDLISDFSKGCTPFVQFVHKESGVTCKFTYDSSLSLEASKMIRFIILFDPRLLDLFQLVRYWGQFHKLSGPQAIPNYALTLLLIVFLASKKIIPSVTDLQTMCSYSKKINGWNTAYCTDANKIKSMLSFKHSGTYNQGDPVTGKPSATSVLHLAKEFFEMYAHVDFEKDLVCPHIGNVWSKSSFSPGNENQLPLGLQTFKQWTQLKSNGSQNQFNTHSPLCIQDVFNLGQNVSENTSEITVKNFQSMCEETVDSIQKVLACANPKLMDIFEVDICIVSSVVVPPKVYVPKPTSKPEPNISTVTFTTENKTAPSTIPTSGNPFQIPSVNYDPTPPQIIYTRLAQTHAPIPNCDYNIPAFMFNSPFLSKSVHDILKFDGGTREVNPSFLPSFLSLPQNKKLCPMETNLIMAPCEDFIKLFKRNIQGLASESNTNKALHSLWCSFLYDFFNTVWTTSFIFQPCHVHPDLIVSNPHGRFKYTKNKFFDVGINPNPKITALFPPDRNPYCSQFLNINSNFEMMDLGFICYFDKLPIPFCQYAFALKITFLKNKQHNWTACATLKRIVLDSIGYHSQQQQGYNGLVQCLPRTLKFLVLRYQMFRLHQWLGMNATNNN